MTNSARYSITYQATNEYVPVRPLISYTAARNQLQCRNTVIPLTAKRRMAPPGRVGIAAVLITDDRREQSESDRWWSPRTMASFVHVLQQLGYSKPFLDSPPNSMGWSDY